MKTLRPNKMESFKKNKTTIRSKSTPDRVTTIPIVNQKPIPLHFRPYYTNNFSPTSQEKKDTP